MHSCSSGVWGTTQENSPTLVKSMEKKSFFGTKKQPNFGCGRLGGGGLDGSNFFVTFYAEHGPKKMSHIHLGPFYTFRKLSEI